MGEKSDKLEIVLTSSKRVWMGEGSGIHYSLKNWPIIQLINFC